MGLNYWSVRSFVRVRGNEVKGADGGCRYFSQVRESHKNLLRHPSNNISTKKAKLINNPLSPLLISTQEPSSYFKHNFTHKNRGEEVYYIPVI